jgi:hypothetical protein
MPHGMLKIERGSSIIILLEPLIVAQIVKSSTHTNKMDLASFYYTGQYEQMFIDSSSGVMGE